jgi:hypothetical protein
LLQLMTWNCIETEENKEGSPCGCTGPHKWEAAVLTSNRSAHVLCFCNLFKDAVNNSEYMTSNHRTISEQWIGKDEERSGCDLTEVQRLVWRNWGKWTKSFSQNSSCSGSDSNRVCPEQ